MRSWNDGLHDFVVSQYSESFGEISATTGSVTNMPPMYLRIQHLDWCSHPSIVILSKTLFGMAGQPSYVFVYIRAVDWLLFNLF